MSAPDSIPRPRAPWYVFPSANPDNARACIAAWRARGYRVAVLEDRVPILPAGGTDSPEAPDAVVRAATYPGWAASINRLIREAVPRDVPVVVAGGDDLWPDAEHDASSIVAEFLARFPDTFGVMQPTGDDYEATTRICGSPWLGRAWIDRAYAGRGPLCEEYHQQYADEELYRVARAAGCLWARPDLTQRHDHFRRLGRPAPAYWVESAAAHEEHDCLTFIARRAARFPGALPDGRLDAATLDADDDGRAEARYRTIVAGHVNVNTHAARRIERAFADLAADGIRRVALYGAGQHTRSAGAALAMPVVEVVGIIDDDPDRIGRRLWAYPIIDPDTARALVTDGRIEAVVLSSDAMESALLHRAAPLETAGARVIPLYADRTAADAPVVAAGARGT